MAPCSRGANCSNDPGCEGNLRPSSCPVLGNGAAWSVCFGVGRHAGRQKVCVCVGVGNLTQADLTQPKLTSAEAAVEGGGQRGRGHFGCGRQQPCGSGGGLPLGAGSRGGQGGRQGRLRFGCPACQPRGHPQQRGAEGVGRRSRGGPPSSRGPCRCGRWCWCWRQARVVRAAGRDDGASGRLSSRGPRPRRSGGNRAGVELQLLRHRNRLPGRPTPRAGHESHGHRQQHGRSEGPRVVHRPHGGQAGHARLRREGHRNPHHPFGRLQRNQGPRRHLGERKGVAGRALGGSRGWAPTAGRFVRGGWNRRSLARGGNRGQHITRSRHASLLV
jgi:hypothetical protein